MPRSALSRGTAGWPARQGLPVWFLDLTIPWLVATVRRVHSLCGEETAVDTTVAGIGSVVVAELRAAGYMESTIGQYRKSIKALACFVGEGPGGYTPALGAAFASMTTSPRTGRFTCSGCTLAATTSCAAGGLSQNPGAAICSLIAAARACLPGRSKRVLQMLDPRNQILAFFAQLMIQRTHLPANPSERTFPHPRNYSGRRRAQQP